ncbi:MULTISPECIES: sensor histidine kinase [unclassified Virgibacillus]|uniref:ATP-binding protein n=1 Tax=unclassified Virgibacillus TaxID=2620237 RepID=UPI00090AC77C|nr:MULTISPECIES: sensor histidine kinase [unclassified Virgibacillus]API92994.1 histidine kinase [Virgibacillus sp. 6R]MBS7428523.1 sensor histidine kinase [Virgibacillus sp. 19R1-5]
MLVIHKWQQRWRVKQNFSLKVKMICLISILIIGVFIIFGLFLRSFISTIMEDQIAKRALSVAQSVANMPSVQEAFERKHPETVIQDIVKPIQRNIGAEFIVVGNREEIRYSHPEVDKIGKKMVGGDNNRALEKGEAYISKRKGSLGLSIRGKAPIKNQDGAIIGVVSVGFLNEEVQSIIQKQSRSLWLTLLGIILLGVIGAIVIATYLKKLLSGMEPEEITQLLLQKEAILQSTHEGIIAVDNQGRMIIMNTAAQNILLKQEVESSQYMGRSVRDFLPHTGLFHVLETGEKHYNKEMILGDTVVLANRTPIFHQQSIIGAVTTFREKTELESITKELSQIKQYANAQRAQTHEFSNKLYTILGLLQLGKQEEAISFIKQENKIQGTFSQFLLENITDPMIQGLLQGKLNQANELGITMSIHPNSQLIACFSGEKQRAFLTAVGNLLENAIESVKHEVKPKREIAILLTDIGNDVIVEVDDSGEGLSSQDLDHIFEQGYTKKEGEHRGVGLALSKHLLNRVGGDILVEGGELGGARFIIIIPK